MIYAVALLLAQIPASGPIDWQGWAQLGFAAGVAVYLLVYDGPRTRDKYEASLKAMIADFKAMMTEERAARKEEITLLRSAFQCRGE